MSRKIAVLLTATLFLGGCSGMLDSLRSTFEGPPTATIENVSISAVDLQSVTLEFDLEVMNPYTFALPLVGMDYALSTNAQRFLDGSMDLEGSIPAEGMRTISLPVRVDFAGLFDTVKDLRPGQVIPLESQLGLKVEVPGAGPLVLPLNQSGELPIPTPPRISIASFDWDSISLTEVTGSLLLDIANPNEFNLTLKSFDYDLSLAGHSVASGENPRSLWMSAEHETQVTIPLSFSPSSAGTALVGMLGSGTLDYSMAGNLEVETPFGMISMPYERDGRANQSR